jgi:pantoate--beta-alanine ligase
LESDILKLESIGCDILFIPSREEIYPRGYKAEHYDLGTLEQILEGKYRPGHFQGVCQVVDILLQIILPDKLFLGQKDLQQCRVIEKLLELTRLDNKISLVICPTVREQDGLAMSSRNMRLGAEERIKAVSISKTLKYIIDNLRPERTIEPQTKAIEQLTKNGLKVDYVAIVDSETLLPIEKSHMPKGIAVLAAAYAGEIRLIDNMLVELV